MKKLARFAAFLPILFGLARCTLDPALAAVETTTVTGKILLPTGAPATAGTVTATLSNAGTAPDGIGGFVVVSSRASGTIASDGTVSLVLVPNDVISPATTYYIVKFSATTPTSTSWTENWVVVSQPDPISIGLVTRTNTPPGLAPPVSTIMSNGTALTKRTKINFVGSPSPCVDNAGQSRIDCTITAGVGGGGGDFGSITTGTNMTALHVGTGGTLDATGSGTITATSLASTLAVNAGGTGAINANGARNNLGLTIGSAVEAWDTDLDAIGALSCIDGQIPKKASGVWTCSADSTGGSPTFDTVGTGDSTGKTLRIGANSSMVIVPASNGIIQATDVACTNCVALGTETSGSLAGDVTGVPGTTVVGKINGVSMAGLATGILKNTTTTGVPSIAVAVDFPTLNQNTTGSAATVPASGLTGATLASGVTASSLTSFGASPTLTTPTIGVATATSVNKVAITAPATSATLTIGNGFTLTASGNATVSGTNTGDQTTVSGNAGTATVLAANGANCSASQAPLGVDAAGAVEGCFGVVPSGTAALVDADVSASAAIQATKLQAANNLTNGGVLTTGAQTIGGVKTFSSTIAGTVQTAVQLLTPRTINGVSFDGTANITVPAAAGTLTGATLASGVTASSLTSVGTLAGLTVSPGTIAGSITGTSALATNLAGGVADQVMVQTASGTGTFRTIPDCIDSAGNHLNFTAATDTFSCGTTGGGGAGEANVTADVGAGSVSLRGTTPKTGVALNLRTLSSQFTQAADVISLASGGILNNEINASAGIVDTKLATISTAGKVLDSATTATSSNVGNSIVRRDGSGNFTAGTITAALTGLASSATTSAGVSTNDAGGDTSTFPLLGGTSSGSQQPLTDAGLTYDATTDILTVAGGPRANAHLFNENATTIPGSLPSGVNAIGTLTSGTAGTNHGMPWFINGDGTFQVLTNRLYTLASGANQVPACTTTTDGRIYAVADSIQAGNCNNVGNGTHFTLCRCRDGAIGNEYEGTGQTPDGSDTPTVSGQVMFFDEDLGDSRPHVISGDVGVDKNGGSTLTPATPAGDADGNLVLRNLTHATPERYQAVPMAGDASIDYLGTLTLTGSGSSDHTFVYAGVTTATDALMDTGDEVCGVFNKTCVRTFNGVSLSTGFPIEVACGTAHTDYDGWEANCR